VGIGVQKTLITPWNSENGLMPSTDLVARARAAGLKVHAWTVRPENFFLPVEMRLGDDLAAPGNVAAEIRLLLDQGVDGLFCDRPADAMSVLADWRPPA
jgi:glycerophosphoryl diester phosphodiesterase